MPQQDVRNNLPRFWNTRRAAKRAVLAGVGLLPVLWLLDPHDLNELVRLYGRSDWPALVGYSVGLFLGAAVGASILTALFCVARNFGFAVLHPNGRIASFALNIGALVLGISAGASALFLFLLVN